MILNGRLALRAIIFGATALLFACFTSAVPFNISILNTRTNEITEVPVVTEKTIEDLKVVLANLFKCPVSSVVLFYEAAYYKAEQRSPRALVREIADKGLPVEKLREFEASPTQILYQFPAANDQRISTREYARDNDRIKDVLKLGEIVGEPQILMTFFDEDSPQIPLYLPDGQWINVSYIPGDSLKDIEDRLKLMLRYDVVAPEGDQTLLEGPLEFYNEDDTLWNEDENELAALEPLSVNGEFPDGIRPPVYAAQQRKQFKFLLTAYADAFGNFMSKAQRKALTFEEFLSGPTGLEYLLSLHKVWFLSTLIDLKDATLFDAFFPPSISGKLDYFNKADIVGTGLKELVTALRTHPAVRKNLVDRFKDSLPRLREETHQITDLLEHAPYIEQSGLQKKAGESFPLVSGFYKEIGLFEGVNIAFLSARLTGFDGAYESMVQRLCIGKGNDASGSGAAASSSSACGSRIPVSVVSESTHYASSLRSLGEVGQASSSAFAAATAPATLSLTSHTPPTVINTPVRGTSPLSPAARSLVPALPLRYLPLSGVPSPIIGIGHRSITASVSMPALHIGG